MFKTFCHISLNVTCEFAVIHQSLVGPAEAALLFKNNISIFTSKDNDQLPRVTIITAKNYTR
jgi:hypothetical protein